MKELVESTKETERTQMAEEMRKYLDQNIGLDLKKKNTHLIGT